MLGVKRRRLAADFAGRIYADLDGQLVMDLNAADADERQRFTCAHELIHLAFPGFKKETRYRLEAKTPGGHRPNDEEEFLCDVGAASLLMPSTLVAGRYDVEEGLSAVERLARDARVSLQAAGNRLVALASEASAFLVLTWTHKPADRPALRRGEDVPMRLRVRYASVNGIEGYLPRFKATSDDSVFTRAWHSPTRQKGRDLLPGAERAGAFNIDAKAYGSGERRVVLAVAHAD